MATKIEENKTANLAIFATDLLWEKIIVNIMIGL